MFEGFEALEEGIIYGILEDYNNRKIIVNIKGIRKEYDFRENLISFLNNIGKKSFIRAYVKNNEIIYIEKINEELYKKYMKLLDEIKNIK